jgi:phosphonate metabolism protein (transferase hexapeptide repeat family)
MTRTLSIAPFIHPEAQVVESRLGRYTEIGARSMVTECELGDYSYVANDSELIYARIGKFCSIAAHTRINPGNHPMERASQAHFTYRASAYFPGEADEAALFDRRRAAAVAIGHDVWIGHGAIVLPGRARSRGRGGDSRRGGVRDRRRRSGTAAEAAVFARGRRAAGGARLVGLGS